MGFFANFGILSILLLALYICLPFVHAFIWAVIVYQAGLPLQQRLRQRFSPTQTSLLMLLIVVMTIIIPVLLVGGQLGVEATNAYQRLEEQGFTTPTAESVRQLILNSPIPAPLRDYLVGGNLETILLNSGKTAITFSSSLLGIVAVNVGNFIFSLVVFLFLYFLICTNGAQWSAKMTAAVPKEYQIDSLLSRLASAAAGLFWGVAGTCLAQGIVGGLIFLLLGLPSPLLITALISFCALIPVVGTAIIWGPFALWLVYTGAWVKALILTLSGIFVISSMDNLVRPLLTKIGGAQLSALTVTLGAIGGIAAFGLTGLVIGPLALESFSWLLDRLGQIPDEKPIS